MYEELVPNLALLPKANVVSGVPPADVLRKELENELRYGNEDIRSYAWYHGKVPRDVAEDLTRNNGDFLVRESITNVGDYVLTCKYKSVYYHFKINKVTVQKSPEFSSVQYYLEEQHFESLPVLVHWYLKEKLPVSKKTGVILGQAVHRAMPISYSDVRYASLRRQPRGKPTGGSFKQYNNNNNKTAAGIGPGLSPQNQPHDSLSSSQFSSVSSTEFSDKSGLSPRRTPSPRQTNAVCGAPKTTTTALLPHQRQSSDPLPVIPVREAVVLEQHIVPNSYGCQSHTVTYSNKTMSAGMDCDVTTDDINGAESRPFPLSLDGNGSTGANSSQFVSVTVRTMREDRLRVSNRGSHRPASQVDMNVESHGKHVSRSGSDPLLSPTVPRNRSNPHNTNGNNGGFRCQAGHVDEPVSDSLKSTKIPPKPSRFPSYKESVVKATPNGKNDASSQEGSVNTSADLIVDNAMETPAALATVSPSSSATVNLRSKLPRAKRAQELAARRRKRASCFKPAQYQCTMLSPENPPLEERALAEIKNILLGVDPFKLARHMTVIDCKVCRIMEGELERILLPHASQLRHDIVERYQCIAFWVAICVIKCTTGREERAEMLNKFIQIANELVHSMGNVFGFSAIMHGLTCPQVLSLDSSWELLHLKFTNNAVTFEKKLRPLLQLMDEGKGQIRLGAACIPHLMPLIRLLVYPGSGIPHVGLGELQAKKSASFGSLLDRISPSGSLGNEDTSSLNIPGQDATRVDWWENIPDEGFDSLLSHLHAGRTLLKNLDELKKIANLKLVDFKEKPKMREMFTTDFQMRLLFGYRSSESPRQDRFHKFDRIITAMLRHVVD